MSKTMLADLTDGMTVQTLAYLKGKRLIPFRNKPGAFLVLTLADRSGGVDAKVFDNAEEVHQRLEEGTIIQVSGRASNYQGTLGLVVENAAVWSGAVDMSEFMPAYQGDVAALEAKLDALVASISDADLARLLNNLFTDPAIRTKFCTAPAAKHMHGAYLHGLLEHVIRQADLAEAVSHCYPRLDRDMLIAGVLLHDIGKIVEFTWELGIEYSKFGNLQGHAVIGDRLVYERGRELDINEETAMRLSHLILSHHGQHEYGAVVLPQTLEAVVLHSLDNLEAKATHCISMLEGGDSSAEWTEYDRIEGRYWYRGQSLVTS